MLYQSIDPVTNQLLHSFPADTLMEAEPKLKAAAAAFHEWKQLTFKQRAAYLHRLAVLLSQNENELAQLATLEMGKPVQEAVKEMQKSALTLRFLEIKPKGC